MKLEIPSGHVYSWERKTYSDFDKFSLDARGARKYLKKLCRHYKTTSLLLKINSRKRGGGTYYGSSDSSFYQSAKMQSRKKGVKYYDVDSKKLNNGLIVLTKNTDLGTVVHEFTHHLARIKYGPKVHHSKKFKKLLVKVYKWSQRYLPK